MSASKKHKDVKTENLLLKREVEQLRNVINNKLKDSAMAKKAAKILEEMINTPK